MSDSMFSQRMAEWAYTSGPTHLQAQKEAICSFVDTAACVLGGRSSPQVQGVLASHGAFGEPHSAYTRAMALGVAAHALDFDDYDLIASTHPSAVIIPALVALCEKRPEAAETLTEAYVVGYETIVALGSLLGYGHYEAGWHATATIGAVGVAAACAKALGLEGERFCHAVAFSASMASGLQANFGTHAKAIHAGLTARNGLQAAAFAASGLVANPGVFDQELGFVSVFAGDRGPQTHRVSILEDRPALVTSPPARKPWPSCAYTHRLIKAALTLAPTVGDDFTHLDRITIRIPQPYFRISSFRRPQDESQARFSVTYCVAAALMKGAITFESFEPATLAQPDIVELEARIQVAAYEPAEDPGDLNPAYPDSLEIRLADHRILTSAISVIPGGRDDPLTDDHLIRKYESCGGEREKAKTALTSVSRLSSALLDCFT